jgi:hypothetical protein
MRLGETKADINSIFVGDGTVKFVSTNLSSKTNQAHQCRFYIGLKTIERLGWTHETRVKFQWGSGAQHGFLRILPVTNPKAGGWKLTFLSTGPVRIINISPPSNMQKMERVVDLAFTIGAIDEVPEWKFLDLELPNNFYQPNTTVTTPGFTHVKTRVVATILLADSLPQQKKLPIVNASMIPSGNIITGCVRARSLTIDTTWDIVAICRYITTEIGGDARAISARSVRINGADYTPKHALDYANQYRNQKQLPPLQLRNQV